VFAIAAPGPGFGDVIGIVETEDEVMLVASVGRGEVAGFDEVEAEFLNVVGGGGGAHVRLVVCGAVMDEGDAVAVDAVDGHHFFHTGRRDRFQDGGIGNHDFEGGLDGHAVLVLALPVAGKGLQASEDGDGVRSSNKRQRAGECEKSGNQGTTGHTASWAKSGASAKDTMAR